MWLLECKDQSSSSICHEETSFIYIYRRHFADLLFLFYSTLTKFYRHELMNKLSFASFALSSGSLCSETAKTSLCNKSNTKNNKQSCADYCRCSSHIHTSFFTTSYTSYSEAIKHRTLIFVVKEIMCFSFFTSIVRSGIAIRPCKYPSELLQQILTSSILSFKNR